MAPKARESAVEIVRVLRGGGHVAYLAGGCVRDELLGLVPNDYDVATDAMPARVGELFRGVREVGKAFGVCLVRMKGVTVEVTTFRRESGYTDKRRPDSVEFCDAETDARRRDFTINALYIDPLDESGRVGGRVIDFVDGQADLKRGVVRAVGDPDRRLSEDDLRALRAVRFAARFGFDIDGATAAAIRRHARELRGLSRERIGEELRMMFDRPPPSRAAAARLMQQLGLDGPALDDAPLPGAEARVTASLPARSSFALGLAAWALDRALATASPGSGTLAVLGALDMQRDELTRRWRRALCLSNDERDELAGTLEWLVALVLGDGGLLSWGVARQKRAAAGRWFAGAMRLLGALDAERAAAITARCDELEQTWAGIAPPPLVTGDDLVAAGHAPGPNFARWLEEVYDAQLEGLVRDRASAMQMIGRLARE
jgi:poly(A) polymerase